MTILDRVILGFRSWCISKTDNRDKALYFLIMESFIFFVEDGAAILCLASHVIYGLDFIFGYSKFMLFDHNVPVI